VLRQAAKLKVISKWGTGIDSIDRQAAAGLGIRVCNTTNAFTDPVADTTLGLILCFARGLPFMDRQIRNEQWTKPDLKALRECTLGVIGVGNIGKAVVRRARSFGMKVLGTDPVAVPDEFIVESNLKLGPLHVLLAQADFVTIHCDLNPTSFHLIGSVALGLMKPSAYLINTARGPIVDEAALVEALRAGRLAGAGLDVFEAEPLPLDSPLRTMTNCLLSPHNSNSDLACRQRVHESTIANLLAGLQRTER
jgi:D-3-phosphoglycerate dehydrogenase